MKEHPILMNAAMVRAVLDGSKTQTRRALKRQPDYPIIIATDPHTNRYQIGEREPVTEAALLRASPYGQPGDRLWVRETFGYVSPDEQQRPHSECKIEYRADLAPGCTDRPGQWPIDECKGDPERPRWRPSIHMPRAASRILLEIVSVRVESLQDISEADALTEGVRLDKAGGFFIDGADGRHASPVDSSAIEAFKSLWESTGGSWAANPWLWVIEFKRVMP
ncbi:hypothetical protein [Janthinobacterium sp. UMAB-60]|uniref:hypothetical protein n=1 Tax=Janthinobacterium sp. UMAB-60 TaxID=1365365 RepID=UPI001C574015|nr:hypothetical protein [Janthinobacterium sp. UMAB-60]